MRRKPDQYLHLRLCPETQKALEAIREQIEADPGTRALLRVRGSKRIPHTRVVLYAIGVASAYGKARAA